MSSRRYKQEQERIKARDAAAAARRALVTKEPCPGCHKLLTPLSERTKAQYVKWGIRPVRGHKCSNPARTEEPCDST